MQMFFEGSSNVTLLFDFWNVHEPGGMVLSVIVVLLLTVLYEFLKVWRMSLEKHAHPLPTPPILLALYRTCPCFSPVMDPPEMLANSSSEPSVASMEMKSSPVLNPRAKNRWLFHSLQTCLHMIEVVLGYALMLCVMSYNIWIFLGIIMGSMIGYFLAFPCLGYYMKRRTEGP